MKEHFYNKEEYARRITCGEIDINTYYASPSEVEVQKAYSIIKHFFSQKQEKILDLGCSLGFYSFRFVNKDKFIVAVDYELQSLLIANKHKETFLKKEYLNLAFLQADALHLPFHDGAFDKISNVDFIEHIVPTHQATVVQEICRVLKHDGKVYTYTPNYTRLRLEYYFNKIKYALHGRHFGWQENKPYKDKPDLPNHQDTLLHVGLLSFQKVKQLFLQNGFSADTVLYTEYSIPFLTSFSQKLIKKFNIEKPPFYSIFCSNSSIIFKKR